LLDEPTAHLDLNNRVEIMKLLKQLTRDSNKTILTATHDLDLALQTADTIWLTGKNKDIISGIPEDLVLSGQFDSIFEFKGFDLKTGKVIHLPFRNTTIALRGEGHYLLWTKNALERNGYKIEPSGNIEISIHETSRLWTITQQSNSTQASSINDLLNVLQSISA
jgi:iron complex transport system ATP-binding protein